MPDPNQAAAIAGRLGKRGHRALQRQLIASSRAHFRAANRWAFAERDLWRMICSNKLMKNRPLGQRVRAYRSIMKTAQETAGDR